MTNYEYEKAVKDLVDASSGSKRTLLSLDEHIRQAKKLNIDSFLSLLYSIFNKNKMLLEEPSDKPIDRNKFFYTEINPDYPHDTITNNVVTYEIHSRSPAVNDSRTIGKVTSYRPRYLYEIDDIKTNERAAVYSLEYDNEIRFTCWSEKAEDARRIASMLENFFVKNYAPIKRYVGHFLYKGRSPTIMSSDFGNKRLFGIPLIYSLRTVELGYIKQSEIVSIDALVELASSSTQLEE